MKSVFFVILSLVVTCYSFADMGPPGRERSFGPLVPLERATCSEFQIKHFSTCWKIWLSSGAIETFVLVSCGLVILFCIYRERRKISRH